MKQEKRNILIIDSSEEKVRMLTELLEKMHDNLNICAVKSGNDAYKYMLRTTIDVFVMDILLDADQYGDTSGIRVAEHIREIERYIFTPIVFVTAVKNSELYAYQKLHCMGYIKKPYDKEELERVFRYVLRFKTKRNSERTIIFRNRSLFYPVILNEIVYIESIMHQMYVHLRDGSEIAVPYRTCKKLLEEMDLDCFIQCNRSQLLNKKYVSCVNVSKNEITMRCGYGRISIGSSFKENVLIELGAGK